jgi:uncharacterized protein (TIGR03083 family)
MAPVPSCPGWTLGNLVRHVGGGHRWVEDIIRTRATDFLPDDQVRKLDGDDSAEVPTGWLTEGAEQLERTLRAAGPETEIWAPFEYHTMSFWARRFAHETVIHRADATLATGTAFAVADDVALDAVDEWMELDVHPQHFDLTPEKREILGPDRTLALEATDDDATWFVDLTGKVNTWRRGSGPAAATVRGSLSDLLLVIYRRKSLRDNGIDVLGDGELLDLWMGHVGFG